MTDVFVEYMVKKKNTPANLLLRIGIVLLAMALIVVLFFATAYLGEFSFIGTLAMVGVLYGAYFLITSFDVEYEYILTNGEIDMDKIIHQRKRKRVITVSCRDFEDFGRYDAAKHAGSDYKTRLMLCDAPASDSVYYCVVRHKAMGKTLVAFNANEKMLSNIKKYIPRQMAAGL